MCWVIQSDFFFYFHCRTTMEQNMRSRKKGEQNSLSISEKKWKVERSCSEQFPLLSKGAKYNARSKRRVRGHFLAQSNWCISHWKTFILSCSLGVKKVTSELACHLLLFMDSVMESGVVLFFKGQKISFVDSKSLWNSLCSHHGKLCVWHWAPNIVGDQGVVGYSFTDYTRPSAQVMKETVSALMKLPI